MPKRTVRCSYCHRTGHNRAGCPDLKKYVEENPDSWTAQRHAAKKAARTRTRSCSYCSGKGHNRRGCESLKRDKATAVSLNHEWRRRASEHLKREGWGVGALLRIRTYHGEENLYMITRMMWENMDFRVLLEDHAHNVCEATRIDALGQANRSSYHNTEYLIYPPDAKSDATMKSRKWGWNVKVEVVSPLPEQAVESQFPDGWERGEGDNKAMMSDIFQNGRRRWSVGSWIDDE